MSTERNHGREKLSCRETVGRRFNLLVMRMFLGLLLVAFCGSAQTAYAGLTITPVSWNVIGLDHNNVSSGPDTFQIGARVCNTGGAAVSNVVSTFVWDSTNIYLTLNGNSTLTVPSLNAGACIDFYYPVTITRTSSAYDTTRRYHITATATGQSPVSTPTPRELYIEHIISQGRNSVISISGPTTVFVGSTYTYTLNSSTATQGYEQLETFLNFSNVMFQVLSISTTYTAGGTNDKFYADACGWDNNPLSGNYRSCIGPENYPSGKAGGDVVTIYTVKILSTGVHTADSLILDKSGSSYHYNNDYGTSITITALPPPVPNIGLQKSVMPNTSLFPGMDLAYTIAFTNTGTANATNFVLRDPVPPNTDFKLGSEVSSLGTTGLTVAVTYSNNGGTTFVYVPASGAGGAPAGYDRNVTDIRWTFTGSLSQTSPNNTGSIGFTARIR